MALGKNLKRKKLIEDEKPLSKSKPAKKKVVEKKELIKKTTPAKKKPVKKAVKQSPKKPVSKKETVTKRPAKTSESVVVSPKEDPVFSVGLPIFIAEEVHSLKQRLRTEYESELKELKGKRVQFLVFKIGGESYAIDMRVVKEIVPLPLLSKTPNTPAHIKGIANIRGNTSTVYDLSEKFKIKGDQLAKFLLVLSEKYIPASLMIGELPTTLKVEGEDITSSLSMIEDASLDVSFIKGIIHNENKLIYYLDIIELLKNDKAIVVPDKYLKITDD